jgi:hypothetical protein
MHHKSRWKHMRRALVATYDAKGGPAEPYFDDSGRKADPTTAGTYVLDRCTQHVSRQRYSGSKIAWGTPLRDDGKRVTALIEGHWRSVEEITGMSRADVIAYYARLYKKEEVPGKWLFNDFGHLTCYYFRDENHDGRLGAGEKVMADMLHSTPDDEAETASPRRLFDGREKVIKLTTSHGCIHVRPKDIDDMRRRRFLGRGTLFVVHEYGALPVLSAPQSTHPPYEIHFWPGASVIIVLGWIAE